MQMFNTYKGLKGIGWPKGLATREDNLTQTARWLVKILNFFKKHGLTATRDAFGVSKFTLYRVEEVAKRIHQGIDNIVPLRYLIIYLIGKNSKKSNMLWTCTAS